MSFAREVAYGYNLLRMALSQHLPTPFNDDYDMTKFLPLLAVLALAGCATSETTYLNNGEQGLAIDCSGEANSWATCYEKADASCAGTGYRIVGTDGSPAPAESDKTLGVDVGNYKNRSVVVVCK
ncbi:hypothetical protein SAMN04490202_5705 [Pseudomonas reinekei]|uniref:Lipoprotein n=2 Tax=Pseudomonas reinekei TaxID=395598 RepID=A0A1H0UY76_PSERE|nr:hypothetical protein SAMN04490202_5705 [Pseudomonas reinekei]